ncbi:hypothetical protein D3C72_1696590 [compost metagenome]
MILNNQAGIQRIAWNETILIRVELKGNFAIPRIWGLHGRVQLHQITFSFPGSIGGELCIGEWDNLFQLFLCPGSADVLEPGAASFGLKESYILIINLMCSLDIPSDE